MPSEDAAHGITAVYGARSAPVTRALVQHGWRTGPEAEFDAHPQYKATHESPMPPSLASYRECPRSQLCRRNRRVRILTPIDHHAHRSDAAAVTYAHCLRGHGVPNFPDPSPGAPVSIPSDIDADAPAFKSAQAACAKLLPAGRRSASSSESWRVQLLAVARCMRQHGVPTFADPTSSPPPPGHGNVMGAGGVYLATGPPASQQSPSFRSAATTCHLP
jgi:hypothetical protein